MYEDPSYPPYHPPQRQAAATSFWRKLGGGSLSISIIVHAILLAIGVVWIFQIIPAQKKEVVDFMPKSGGGGASQAASVTQKKRATMTTTPNAPRLAAKGSSSTFTLPDVDANASMASLGSLSAGALSGGLGGSGGGGGRGTGNGVGFGAGTAPGLSNGAGTSNPFGMADPNAGALIGTFYDFKQTRSHKSTEIYPDQLPAIIKEFTDKNWRESTLSKYYRAPQKLYQTKLYIPTMPAEEGPKAFNCENEVKPSRWMVVYRGVVTPPKSGKYRFVGLGDDCMVIRFNNQHVFDYGWVSGTAGLQLSKCLSVLKGTKEDADISRKLKDGGYPMPLPMTFYQYPGIPKWNDLICGLAVGAEFEAKVGTSYPIEILISEVPGGSFGAMLLIEEVGATYKKTANGAPILPLFRTDNSMPADTKAVPLDPVSPPWRVTGTSKTDI